MNLRESFSIQLSFQKLEVDIHHAFDYIEYPIFQFKNLLSRSFRDENEDNSRELFIFRVAKFRNYIFLQQSLCLMVNPLKPFRKKRAVFILEVTEPKPQKITEESYFCPFNQVPPLLFNEFTVSLWKAFRFNQLRYQAQNKRKHKV